MAELVPRTLEYVEEGGGDSTDVDLGAEDPSDPTTVTSLAAAVVSIRGAHSKDVLLAYRSLNHLRMAHSSAQGCYEDLCAAMDVQPDKTFLQCCLANDTLCETGLAAAALDTETTEAATTLDMHRSYVAVRSFLPIVCSLRMCFALQCINFAGCRLDATQIVLLCDALSPSYVGSLKMIDVSRNPFGSVGVQALLQLALKHHSVVNIVVDGVETVPALHRRLVSALRRNAVGHVAKHPIGSDL